jgi:cytochrome c oxidase subunit 4
MKSPRFYLVIAVALLVLLAVTVGMSFVDLGPFNTIVAMLISVSKAVLILLFFMHLRHGGPLLRLFAGVGFFWLGIMLTLALSDYLTRHHV